MATIEKSIKEKINWKFIQHIEDAFIKYQDESEYSYRNIYVKVLTSKLTKCPCIQDKIAPIIYDRKQNAFSKLNEESNILSNIDEFGLAYVFHYDIFGFDVDRKVIEEFTKKIMSNKFKSMKFASNMDGIDRYIWFI